MASRSILRRLLSGLLVVGVAGVIWKATAQEPAAKPPKPQVVASETLGGAERYQAFVTTDKSIYKAGESVYVRTVVLHHATHKPLPAEQPANPTIEIIGPKGDTVASGMQQTQDSVAGFSWAVPEGQPGGEYTVKVSFPFQGFSPAERKFDIRAYRAPRLNSQIKFLRDGYGPNDEVVGTLHVERAEGGIPVGATVTVVGRVDGEEVAKTSTTVDPLGNATGRFVLPSEIRRGEGTLAMIIEDGGVVETASKTIPILLQTVDLTMFPEGGELVAGLPNRVYLEAFTPAKKPADLAGIIVDKAGKEVAKFRSEHEGRGRFEFTPAAGEEYTLRITEPSGIKTTYNLPEVKAAGGVLQTTQHVFPRGETIVLKAGASSGSFTVTLSKRETEVGSVTVKQPRSGLNEVSFTPPAWADGVLVATLWDEAGQPRAERLVFRQPAKAVSIEITPSAKQYTPGSKAGLKIVTKDEAGQPVSAVVGLSIADDSVLEMVDKRDQRPQLPVQVLLEGEVKELADAHVYLNPQEKKAELAVDLLLGTQGWRRFAFVKSQEFLAQQGDAGRRVLAFRNPQHEQQWFRGGGPGAGGVVFRNFGGDQHGLPLPVAAAPVPVDALADEAAPRKPAAPAKNAPVREAERLKQEVKDLAKDKEVSELRDEKDAIQRSNKLDQAKAADGKFANRAREELAQAGRRRDLEDRAAKRIAGPKGGIAAGAPAPGAFAGDVPFEQVRNDFVAVRVYAHEVRADRKPNDRVDFAETLFWAAGLKTNDAGEAEIGFGLSDSVTSFRVHAEAFGAAGGLGGATTTLKSVVPFYLEPKLPLEISSGDIVQLPIVSVNATDAAIGNVKLKIDAHVSQQVYSSYADFSLAPGGRMRTLARILAGKYNGPLDVTVSATAGDYSDKATRKMVVRPRGFPVEFGRGGLLGPGATASHDVEIPEDLVAGSLETQVVVYPTPLASMTSALERLIQEPCGCFEQTSSTTYPLVMAQQYFMSHQGVDTATIERAARTLETGYNRLIGFECKGGGYEWFGQDPGHDALTAYGLMEFTDMSKVRAVDSQMLNRTKTWLLAQRDGKGTFVRKTHTYHVWLPNPEIATAYNLWALLEAKVDADLATEVKWVREAGEKSENAYVTALAANVLSLGGDKEGESQLLDKLAGKQTDAGNLKGATVSVIGSTGEALEIETTALAVLAWLRNPSFAPQVEKSIKYLSEQCKAGRFGSTQSTILALKAIVAYDTARATPKAKGTLQLVVDGKDSGTPVAFTPDDKGALTLPSLSTLAPGKHTVSVRMTDGSQMPYSVSAKYYRVKPDTSEDCKVHLEVKLRDRELVEGNVTEAAVTVINRKGDTIPTPIAIIGVPGGMEVNHDKLKELVKANRIAAYEVIGREVVLYWRALAPEARVDLPLTLTAAVPGEYTGPASRAYLYYTNEHKHWVEGLAVSIKPRGR